MSERHSNACSMNAGASCHCPSDSEIIAELREDLKAIAFGEPVPGWTTPQEATDAINAEIFRIAGRQ